MPNVLTTDSHIVETAGRFDVCSVCGDDPARDYRLEEAYRPAAGVDALRLCDDCLAIRRNNGEPFVRVSDDGERESDIA